MQDAEGALHRCGAVRTVFSRLVDEARYVAEIARLQSMRAPSGGRLANRGEGGERQMIGAQLAEANDRAELTMAYVTLANAFGLGWKSEAHS